MSDRLTPETDEVELGITNNPRRDPQFRLAIHARYLERQRDAYAETLRETLAIDPCADNSDILNAIRERHPELAGNVQVDLPPKESGDSTSDVIGG